MNVAELERLAINLNSEYDRDKVEAWEYFCDIAPYLVRRVIAAEKLVEALHTARDYVSDAHIGALVHDDGKRVSEAMTTGDLAMIDAALTAYEATK